MRFSVIIPAYNEASYLPRLLDSVRAAAWHLPADTVEIVVADNSSTDATADIARGAGCRVATVTKRSIAAARNGGAAMASGEIFCFIDADSALHPKTFERIDAAMRDPRVIAGATGITLERLSPGLLVVYMIMLPIAWLTGFDTGVVFCRREDFEAIGGYDENMLLAEDVNFLNDLKKLGKERGQTLRRVKDVEALGSTRKFDEHGDWHYFMLVIQIVRCMVRVGFRIDSKQDEIPEITDYWYEPNR